MRVFVSYKKLINSRLEKITKDIVSESSEHGGSSGRLLAEEFTTQLNSGGKRLRGALLLLSHKGAGGGDDEQALQVACALEMIHTYILMIDDVQDRSPIRHGQPTAHVRLAEQFNDRHTGMSLSLNAALYGLHQAEKLLANSGATHETIAYINDGMVITAFGQTDDIINDTRDSVTIDDVLNVADQKTAHYSIENPLTVGLLLAGKDVPTVLKDFSKATGRLYQITDDILGTFGDEKVTGKSPMDDMREGKRTILSVYALQNLKGKDKNMFKKILGKANLNEAEFEQAKHLIASSGALEYAKNQANIEMLRAKEALKKLSKTWSTQSMTFLEQLVDSFVSRTV